ncbi:MAG: hypothetical protein KDD01_17470 [Phaeodactylibacter sp.]|nr:hypothetical protein [Phaeodactylibacter sp.]
MKWIDFLNHYSLLREKLVVLALLLITSALLQAQPGAQQTESLFDYLSKSGQLIELTMKTDMDEVINNRRRAEYQPAELVFTDINGEEIHWEIGVVPRGNYRRRVCDFPPVRLNFSKGELARNGLNPEFDKLKMVTHCLEEKADEDFVLKEYLAYKLYNQLSPNSYRVQLARVTYLDTQGKHRKIKRFAILIEETDELAHRLGGTECELMGQPADSIAIAEENLMAVFQYMIGNEDWSIRMLRNIKLIRPDNGGRLIPVPYDFDFSGFVNTPYAVASSQLGLSHVKQRIFLGNAVETEQLRGTLAHFRRYRIHLRSIVDNFKRLGFAVRSGAIEYIDSFYEMEDDLVKENAKKRKAKRESSVQN